MIVMFTLLAGNTIIGNLKVYQSDLNLGQMILKTRKSRLLKDILEINFS